MAPPRSAAAREQQRAAAFGAAAGLTAALLLLLLAYGLVLAATPPEARSGVGTVLAPAWPLLLILLPAAGAGLGAGLALAWHRRERAPLARLAEQAQVLVATPGVALPAEPRAGLAVPMAEAVMALAAARDALARDAATEAARLARRVERERERLAAVVEQLAFGVVVCNAEGRVLLVNRRARLQFRALAETAATAADAEAAQGGHAFVGLGRSIYAVFDRAMVSQAIERLRRRRERGAAQPSAQFVAATRRGQWLRVRVALVGDGDDDGAGAGAPADAGFLLMLDGIAAEQAQGAERTRRLREAGARASESLAALDGGPAREALRAALDALLAEAQRAVATRWPLEPINGVDLLHVTQGHLQSVTGRKVFVELPSAGAPPVGLQVDCWGLMRVVAHLAGRVHEAFAPPHLRLRLQGLDDGQGDGALGPERAPSAAVAAPAAPARRAALDLVWPGGAMSTETVMTWELDALEGGGDEATVRDVLRRHDARLGFVRDRKQQQAVLRIELPRLPLRDAAASRAPVADPLQPLPGARPEFYDFELFSRREAEGPLAERELASLSFTVFDTETTGLDPRGGDEIIQIAAVRVLGGRVLHGEAYEQLVDPRRSVPAASIAIHGITPDRLEGRPTIAQVLPAFHAFCADTVLVAHNAAFDLRFLQLKEEATGVRFEHPVLDTLLLSAAVHPQQASHRLEDIAARLGVVLDVKRHDALGDARVTAEVLARLLPLLHAKGIRTLGQAQAAARETWYARLAY